MRLSSQLEVKGEQSSSKKRTKKKKKRRRSGLILIIGIQFLKRTKLE